MKKTKIILIGLIIPLLIGGVTLPVMAAEQRMDVKDNELNDDLMSTKERFSHFSGEGFDEKHHCPINVPESFTLIENLTFDNSLTNATPHWIFLSVGKAEQKALLSFIGNANVTSRKKMEWTIFMMKSWMKYPVKYVKTENGAKLMAGKMPNKFSMTPKENKTFQEIERYIAEDMDRVRSEQISIKWFAAPTHSKFMEFALANEKDIPPELKAIAQDAAPMPDNWDSSPMHQMNHGFVPIKVSPPIIDGIGFAPDNFGLWVNAAKIKYALHDYRGAFADMGYASHFITDLGNPFHTPMAQLIPLEKVDEPFSGIIFPNTKMIINYEILHDGYETMVKDKWAQISVETSDSYDIIEPTYSAKNHAVNSWEMSYPLIYQCYWHYINTKDDAKKLDFSDDPIILGISKNRVSESLKNTHGLVHYVTGGQPVVLDIKTSTGHGGSIPEATSKTDGRIIVPYGQDQRVTIEPETGFFVDDVIVDGASVGSQTSWTFANVREDHTIQATFSQDLSPIVPLCKAGEGFDSHKYPQDTPQSDPMTFECQWDGNGRVYLSGSSTELIGAYADDGFTVDTPKGNQFDAAQHWAHQHPPLEITSGLNKGSNTLTVIVRNWQRLSMSYGSYSGNGVDQTPYIIEVNTPAASLAAEKPPSHEDLPQFTTPTDNGLIVNGTLMAT